MYSMLQYHDYVSIYLENPLYKIKKIKNLVFTKIIVDLGYPTL